MTRAAILERAYELYLERKITHGDERLSIVLEDLGYTTGAGYQIWPNQAAFRLDLQVYIAENIDYARVAHVADQIAALPLDRLSFEEFVLAVGDIYVGYFRTREDFFLSLRFLAMDDDRPQQVTDAIRGGYQRLGWDLAERLEKALCLHGRRMRAPLTVEQFSTAITALLEGFALQQRVAVDGGPAEYAGGSHEPFSVAFLALADFYTEAA